MSNIFTKIIDKHVDAFKTAISDDIRAMLAGEGTKAPKNKPGRKPKAAATEPKVAKAPEAARKPRAVVGDTEAAIETIVAFVNKHPDGVTGEEARKSLGMDKGLWARASKGAVSGKFCKTKGAKRGTKYFPSAKAPVAVAAE
jgi:hypothetical protein